MAPKNSPIKAPNLMYKVRLPGVNTYKTQIMVTRRAGIKNLYFFKNPAFKLFNFYCFA
jgi:hypothetical protein